MLQKLSKFLHAKYKKLFLKTKVIFCELDNGILTRSKKSMYFSVKKIGLKSVQKLIKNFNYL